MKPTEILHPDQRQWKDKKGTIHKTKAYLVDKLRRAVYHWREQGYPHTTDTTRRLLQFWFEEDHIVHDAPFEFWFCQREAIEERS
ncbi:MAG: hypothetical protein J7K81_02105 [Methanophagales archaeon]|nr:hypothetical protein [Methanophagales archaeon]